MKKRQTLCGRILHHHAGEVWLMVDGTRHSMTQPVEFNGLPGDLFESEGTFLPNGKWASVSFRIAQPYGGKSPFPEIHSDWNRMHSGEGPSLQILQGVSRVRHLIRSWFENERFLEVDTPAIGSSPGLEVHLDAIEARTRLSMDGPIEQRWLMTSPEYHMKRLLSCDLTRIYQMAKAFRSGEVGVHHNPEFHMLEWYRAFESWKTGPKDTRELTLHIARDLYDKETFPGWKAPIDLSGSWEALQVREAIQRWAGFDPYPWEDRDRLRAKGLESGILFSPQEVQSEDLLVRILVEKVEPFLPVDRPLVLTHYPNCLASLARASEEVPGTAERFEIYLGGVELANGFGELVDPIEQENRFEKDLLERQRLGLPLYPKDERFLGALRTGIPPSVGTALGVDRLAMAALGVSDLRKLLPFPSAVA